MRVYVGELEAGRPKVLVVERPERPDLAEIVEVLAELRHIAERLPGDPGYAERRAELVARKDDLVARIEAVAQAPPAQELDHDAGQSPGGLAWGHGSSGPAALARAVLKSELGKDPPASVYLAFRDDIVTRLSPYHFELAASQVWEWVEANRRLVETELFERPHPAHAVDVPDGLAPEGSARPSVEGGGATASALVEACERAWSEIQANHPELPDAVMILGSGVERGRLVKLGHWWAGRWVADGQTRGEVLLAGEALHLPPAEVFEVLLHEAAHGLNAARGVKDTSRGGRYHNAHFRDAAEQVGLKVTAMPPYGLARTSLSKPGAERYGAAIDRLGDAMRIARQLERGVGAAVGDDAGKGAGRDGAGANAPERRSSSVAAQCQCGRRLRMAPTVLAAGPVLCGVCGVEFTNGVRKEAAVGVEAAVVDRSFLDRRHSALQAESSLTPDPAQTDAGPRRAAEVEAAVRHEVGIGVPVEVLDELARRKALLAELGGGVAEGDAPQQGGQPGLGQGAGDLASSPGGVPDNREELARWYERFGTALEEPMPAVGAAHARRKTALARDLLRADGTLQGPAVVLSGQEYAAGDRVVAAAEDRTAEVPAGTLGTVESVDVAGRSIDVDFATLGRLRVAIEDRLSSVLCHDYVEVEAPVASLAPPGAEPTPVELDLPLPPMGLEP